MARPAHATPVSGGDCFFRKYEFCPPTTQTSGSGYPAAVEGFENLLVVINAQTGEPVFAAIPNLSDLNMGVPAGCGAINSLTPLLGTGGTDAGEHLLTSCGCGFCTACMFLDVGPNKVDPSNPTIAPFFVEEIDTRGFTTSFPICPLGFVVRFKCPFKGRICFSFCCPCIGTFQTEVAPTPPPCT